MLQKLLRVPLFLLPALIILSILPSPSSAKNGPPDFVELAKRLKPTVVNISTEKKAKIQKRFQRPNNSPFGNDPFQDFFDRFFEDQRPQNFSQRSLGSGFIISKDGYVLTNNHVVDGADEIKVKLDDGREFKCELKGADAKLDIALIKIMAKGDFPEAKLGDSDTIEVGEWVMAIGNPFGLAETVTAGIISAKGRVIGSGPYDDYIQTDASINPGNSGGPLFNSNGEVIGINTAIVAGGQGIGFAIPVNMATSILPQLKDKGKVTRGWLGVSIQPVTKELADSFGLSGEKGALVSEVMPDSPADKGGLKAGDIIISFDSKEIKEMNDLPRIVAATPEGKKVQLTVVRDGKEKSFSIVVEKLKDSADESSGAGTDKLGLKVRQITKELATSLGLKEFSGVVITEVTNDSPAQFAGVQKGDIVKEINGKPIATIEDYEKALAAKGKDGMIRILLRHGSSSRFIVIKVD
jgi:serine protease Do